MASSKNSGTNRMAVPEAKEAMNRFKEEVASELGVNLKEGYNGDLTSREAAGLCKNELLHKKTGMHDCIARLFPCCKAGVNRLQSNTE